MTQDELRALLAQNRANRNTIETEIVNLDARMHDAPAEQRGGLEERRTRQNQAIANLDEQRVELEGELEVRQNREAEVRRLAGNAGSRESGDGARGGAGAYPDRDSEPPSNRGGRLDGAMRAIERHSELMTSPQSVEDAVRRDRSGLGARYLEAVGSEHYRSAFGLMLAHPMDAQFRMTPQQAEAMRTVHEATEARALAEGTGSLGGFGVPFALDPTILLSSTGVINPIRELASTIMVATSEWKGVSSDGVTAGFAAEATEASDNSPTLAQPVIHLEKAQAFLPFSLELDQDYAGFQAELGVLLRDAKDVLEATKFLEGAGHGSHEPEGLLTGLAEAQRVQTATAKVLAAGDVYALKEALAARFLVDAEWLAAPATYDAIYRLVGGGSLTELPLLPTREGPLLGRPKSEWSTMSSATTTSKAKIAVIGDLDEFRIADRIGMSIELIPHLFGASQRPTGQRGLYAYWRTGSTVLVPNAFRWLEVK